MDIQINHVNMLDIINLINLIIKRLRVMTVRYARRGHVAEWIKNIESCVLDLQFTFVLSNKVKSGMVTSFTTSTGGKKLALVLNPDLFNDGMEAQLHSTLIQELANICYHDELSNVKMETYGDLSQNLRIWAIQIEDIEYRGMLLQAYYCRKFFPEFYNNLFMFYVVMEIEEGDATMHAYWDMLGIHTDNKDMINRYENGSINPYIAHSLNTLS